MKKVFKSSENPLQDEISENKAIDVTRITHHDEGEHFEIDIFRLIKIRSKRVTVKVIIAIILVLGFVWLIVKW